MDPTRRVPLGKTALRVTALGLGSAPLGGLFSAVDEGQVHGVVRHAYDVGLRFFDTAPLYGHGNAERRMGHVLQTLPRDDFVLSTKVGRLLKSDVPAEQRTAGGNAGFIGVPDVYPVFDFSYDGVMRSAEESRKRLGLDRIDVLLIHDPDDHYDAAISGAYRALDTLRGEGTIRAVGAGMNQAEMLARFAREGDFDCFLLAGRYTLLDHESALKELLPTCVEKGISIIIGGVYNSGILANLGDPARMTFNYQPAEAKWVERAERLQAVCERHGVPLKAAAIQFPLAHPAVATVLTGARSVAELDENAEMFRYPIPVELWQELRAESLVAQEAPLPGD